MSLSEEKQQCERFAHTSTFCFERQEKSKKVILATEKKKF